MVADLALDRRRYRDALAQVPSSVVALCALIDDEPTAMVASSFTVGISESPPLALFAAQSTSSTWPRLRRAERIGVSLLAQGHAALCRQLAHEDRSRRFEGVDVIAGDGGALFLQGTPLALSCRIDRETDAGDHHLVLLHIDEYIPDPTVAPLVFHQSGFCGIHPRA